MMKKNFKGKKIWRNVSGTPMKSKNIDDGSLKANDTKIITWINNSTNHSIGTQKLFIQSNFAKWYQLENDI
jgi:hypothetical protein